MYNLALHPSPILWSKKGAAEMRFFSQILLHGHLRRGGRKSCGSFSLSPSSFTPSDFPFYLQRGKDLFLRCQELSHVISFGSDKNIIQGRVNSYFRGKETESQNASYLDHHSKSGGLTPATVASHLATQSEPHRRTCLVDSTPVFFITNPWPSSDVMRNWKAL